MCCCFVAEYSGWNKNLLKEWLLNGFDVILQNANSEALGFITPLFCYELTTIRAIS